MACYEPVLFVCLSPQETINTLQAVQQQHGVTATSLLNFVVSDGTTLIGTRFVSPDTEKPATLYYSEAAAFQRENPAPAAGVGGCGSGPAPATPAISNSGSSILRGGSYSLVHGERGASVAILASEPITASRTDWVAVPKNTAVIITREKGGFLNIMRSQLGPGCPQALQVRRRAVPNAPNGCAFTCRIARAPPHQPWRISTRFIITLWRRHSVSSTVHNGHRRPRCRAAWRPSAAA